jgi:hypothetical protein
VTSTFFWQQSPAVDNYATAQFTALHSAECIQQADRIIPQFTPKPDDEVYMHVRHMGIPGSEELINQVDNFITWDPSDLTGYKPGAGHLWWIYQRGYKNDPTLGTNVFQLHCRSAGFLINTFQFSHNGEIECPDGFPDCSGGPNVSYSRSFSNPIQVWNSPDDELTLQGRFKLPHVHHNNDGTEGVGQLSMYYNMQDSTSDVWIFGLMGIFGSRPADNNCNRTRVGCESMGDDGIAAAFFSSSLLPKQPDNTPFEFATKSPFSANTQFQWGWSDERFFRGHVKYEQMQEIASRLQHLGASQNPEDWRLRAVGILAETTNGAEQHLDNIVMGGNFRNFEAYRAHD